MHNLRTVFSFEVTRTLKKKTFWIMALAMPLLIGGIFGIVFLSNSATQSAVEDMEKQHFSALVLDKSGLISDQAIDLFGFTRTDDRSAGIKSVKTGKVDAFLYYPADLTKGAEVFGKDIGIFNNGRYDAVARSLIENSVNTSVDVNTRTVISGNLSVQPTTYRDGEVFNPLMHMIAPGLFLVLFYFLIAMFGNQAVTSTTEEKENRVIEMLLTTVKSRTVIIGKLFALAVLALIQAALLITPALVGYILLRETLSLPALGLSSLPFDPVRIGTAFVIFTASFILFIGLLVAIGAAVPTAKEAGNVIGIVMTGLFAPLYAASLFISNPESGIVQFLSYFPLTAPIPLLLRNAAGTITWGEVLIGTTILVISAIFVIRVAIRIFQHGALEYSRKLGFKEIFGKS